MALILASYLATTPLRSLCRSGAKGSHNLLVGGGTKATTGSPSRETSRGTSGLKGGRQMTSVKSSSSGSKPGSHRLPPANADDFMCSPESRQEDSIPQGNGIPCGRKWPEWPIRCLTSLFLRTMKSQFRPQ
jgi:hypothetical protein